MGVKRSFINKERTLKLNLATESTTIAFAFLIGLVTVHQISGKILDKIVRLSAAQVCKENGARETFFATALVICAYIHFRDGTSFGSRGSGADDEIILSKTWITRPPFWFS